MFRLCFFFMCASIHCSHESYLAYVIFTRYVLIAVSISCSNAFSFVHSTCSIWINIAAAVLLFFRHFSSFFAIKCRVSLCKYGFSKNSLAFNWYLSDEWILKDWLLRVVFLPLCQLSTIHKDHFESFVCFEFALKLFYSIDLQKKPTKLLCYIYIFCVLCVYRFLC